VLKLVPWCFCYWSKSTIPLQRSTIPAGHTIPAVNHTSWSRSTIPLVKVNHTAGQGQPYRWSRSTILLDGQTSQSLSTSRTRVERHK